MIRKKNEKIIYVLLDEHPYKVLTDQEFFLLWHKTNSLDGFRSYNKRKLIKRLSENKIIDSINMSDQEKKEYPVYGIQYKKPDIFDYAAARSRASYFSYYTALFIHNLTLQIPKHIYLTFERDRCAATQNTISQKAIDQAFSKPPRQTNNSRSCEGYMIHQVIGQGHQQLGIIPYRENLAVTDIERTLIDIVTRPFYAGGVTQVIEAFKNAKEKIDIKKLLSYYQKMNFIYPYHQAIGFYLEKAGYEEKAFGQFAEMEQKFKFYLSYNIRFKEFSPNWNLYYPKGL
jgi:predicted transcriptional regulator of viral defense system